MTDLQSELPLSGVVQTPTIPTTHTRKLDEALRQRRAEPAEVVAPTPDELERLNAAFVQATCP